MSENSHKSLNIEPPFEPPNIMSEDLEGMWSISEFNLWLGGDFTDGR